ncbi:DUF3772 domain-containing protein [Prosthecomicrobium hirschii]|uniref:DUF3772 domain-containing protein n=1 Tax=Prosthecodimorpha hirschii TaxID=665126 RepID=UPI0022208E40|nr:DUF3772 domain-containing protein [Prosthecomicrobium hirschii]MCW1841218.1 DUF3772 domain-containing protein [Prosthecomicrobium hirschii]
MPRHLIARLLRLALLATVLALTSLASALMPAPLVASAHAQDAPAPAAPPVEEVKRPENPQALLNAWKVEIDQIAAGTQRESLTDRQLTDLRARAEQVRVKAGELIDQLTPGVQAAEARLKQLGPAPQKPKDGEAPPPAESDAVKQDRAQLDKQLAELQGFTKQASLIQLKADEVVKSIGDRRRDRFNRAVMEQSRSILDPTLWLEAAAALPGTIAAFGFLLRDWGGLFMARGSLGAIGVLGLAIAFLALLLRPIRRRLLLATDRNPDAVNPSAFAKSGAAAAIVVVNTALPLIALMTLLVALRALDLNPDRIEQTLVALMIAAAVASAAYSLGLAILAPTKPQWRLIGISDTAAQQLIRIVGLLTASFGIGIFVIRILPVLAAPLSLVIALSGLFALLDIGLTMLALRTVAASLAADDEAKRPEVPTPGPASAPPAERGHSILWRWLVPIAWIAAIAGAVAALVGFVALSRFIAYQLIWAGLNIAVLYILLVLVDEALTATFRRETRVGLSLNRSMGFGVETVEQVGVVLSGLGRLALIGFVVAMILLPLGFSSEDLIQDAKAAFFGFKVGGLTVSLSSILGAVIVFMIAVAVTGGVKGWLEARFLPRTRLDPGLKNSILTAFGYIGYIVAGALAFSSVGVSLENVAIVAGALSVGIGFGLQSIVNNFVSGLILLAERPIKTGDMIEIGAERGFVRKINVRSTEIETFDRASLIVPNSSLITGTVKNWMHRDMTGRVVVNVGVAYNAEPEQVREILLAAAKAHRLVMIFPAPSAFFTDFGESALMFRLICTVPMVTDAFTVESDLRFDIMKRLRSHGIDIPYAQRDLHVRQLDDLRDLLARHLASAAPGPVGVRPAESDGEAEAGGSGHATPDGAPRPAQG